VFSCLTPQIQIPLPSPFLRGKPEDAAPLITILEEAAGALVTIVGKVSTRVGAVIAVALEAVTVAAVMAAVGNAGVF